MRKILLLILPILLLPFGISAQCSVGDCGFGYGTKLFVSNEKYIGHFDKEEFDGQGVYYYADGTYYVGTWKNGEHNGEGRLYNNKGEVESIGIWKKGKLTKTLKMESQCLSGDCQNGYGIYLYANGVKTIGIFRAGEIDGRAFVFYPNGTKYIGAWAKNKMSGEGTLYYPDGTFQSAYWNDVQKEKEYKKENGCIDGDCEDGQGVYIYRNETKYKGYFKGSTANGKGICYYADGDIYLGNWKFHNFDGEGIMYKNDGTVEKGLWRNGELISATDSKGVDDYFNIPTSNPKPTLATPITIIESTTNTATKYHVSYDEAMMTIKEEKKTYASLMDNPSMGVGFFVPKANMSTKKASKDQVFMILTGSGEFILNKVKSKFETGDALSVKEGQMYQFINYSSDLKAWRVVAK